jgi:hypothetical protein
MKIVHEDGRVRYIARAKGTRLGTSNGFFSAVVFLEGEYACAFGGHMLDEYDEKADRRAPRAAGMAYICGILTAFGVDDWEDIPGRTIIAVIDAKEGEGVLSKFLIGLEPLPTEPGEPFYIDKWREKFFSKQQHGLRR